MLEAKSESPRCSGFVVVAGELHRRERQWRAHDVDDSPWGQLVRQEVVRIPTVAFQVRIPAKPISDSGRCRSSVPAHADHPDDVAGGPYLVGFFVPVKPAAFRIESPPSLSRCALWTRRSQIASASVASPITACQSFGSS